MNKIGGTMCCSLFSLIAVRGMTQGALEPLILVALTRGCWRVPPRA